MKTTSIRWWNSLPFLLALVIFVFLGWCGYQAAVYPYDGIISLQPTGLIKEISQTGPAYGKLQSEDLILSVDGVPVNEASPFYRQKFGGSTIRFIVQRAGQAIPVSIILEDPSIMEVFDRLTPILIALIFWVIGVGIQMFKPIAGSGYVYFLFFQTSAVMLATGAVSYASPPWVSSLFHTLLWIIGPLSIHFHTYFPQNTSLRNQGKILRWLYLIAMVGGGLYLYLSTQKFHLSPWFYQLIHARDIFLIINMLGVVGLLFYGYRHTITPGTRSKVRIVLLGGFLSAIPLTTLTILPEVLNLQPIIPYAYGLLLLGLLPLTYGYAIFRHRLIEIEKHVNRGATYILVYSILGAFYLVLYAGIHRWTQGNILSETLLNILLIFVLATIFIPIHQNVKRIVDTAFYGGWYDYRSAVKVITQGLEQITELHVLARTVGERLFNTLRLEDSCVFLRDPNGDFSVIEVSPRNDFNNKTSASFPVLPINSLQYLLNMGETGGISSMRQALSGVTLTPEEYQLLNSEQAHLWIPVVAHGQVQGYLALGPKYGGDIFSGEDMDILRVVAWQIAPVIENIHLLTRLREHAAELEVRVSKRTEELHEAKERVEAILASVGDGVIVTDLDGNILTINAAFEEQSGFSTFDLVGHKFYDQLAEYNDKSLMEEIQVILHRGQVWSGELLYPRKGSKPYNIHLTIAPVYDQSEKMIGYVGSQRDITQQLELNRLKDQFISDVSHELRTPATNLSLYLELLESGPKEKRTEYLNILKGQTKVLVKMIEDILDLSRIEIGKAKKIQFSAVDMNLLTEQVVTAHRPLAEASGLSMVFDPGDNLPPVLGEPNQLARVITNLVSNSIRYTFAGSIFVRTYKYDSKVCLEVQDTGIGIDPEDIPYLFTRFFRGRQVRQSKIHGTGLGLAIVQEIVSVHEGIIDIQSEVGKGSTFQVWLPVCKYIPEVPVDALLRPAKTNEYHEVNRLFFPRTRA